jgi:hypothetical protein
MASVDDYLRRITEGVESMAKSLQVIAFRFNASANQSPVWNVPPFLELTEGTPATFLLSQFVRDPDPDYPGAKPLEIDAQAVLASLPGMGIQVVDLGRDVEIRYDGRAVGATPVVPVSVPNAFIAVADDGVPEGSTQGEMG